MAKIYDASLIGKKQSVVDEILLLNGHQTPMLSLLGFGEAVSQTTHQWFEDEMIADETLVAGAVTNVATSVTVVDGSIFRTNDVIKIGEELLKVTAVAGNVLTVSRGYASTTAAAIADQAKAEFMFSEGVEGADARAARYKARVGKTNKTQIFDDSIELSGTAQAVTQYGINDLYEYEKQKKQLELALQLEKAVINGISYENGQVRQMKGIRQFIQSNVIDVAGALAMDKINDLGQKVYEAGGFATGGNYKVVVGAKQKRKLSALDTNKVQIGRSENQRGEVVDTLINDFGEFEIALNNNLASDELLFVDVNRVAIRPLVGRDFFHVYMGAKGDSTTGIVVGEYTLEFKQEKAHGRLKGLN
jgi:Family of unknown function (DUF5309)